MALACRSLKVVGVHQAQRRPGPAVRTQTCVVKPVQANYLVGQQLRGSNALVRSKGEQVHGAVSGVRSVRRAEVICMAHPKRVARVQQQLKREISTLFVHDKVIRKAIYPTEADGADFALSSLASVTEVNVTNDLQVCKVYVSVLAEPMKQQQTLDALHRLEGYARKKIGQAVRLRLTPEIRFMLDDSFVRGTKVLTVLEKLEVERAARETKSKPSSMSSAFDDEFDKYADYVEEEDADGAAAQGRVEAS
mmetsp:Transcript_11179/g.23310  ORF Transcript_11179/g.23310 Transcript_11179/m.23310 type:complete len:250 (-) Transcript_11179:848-1597(-)|eukprot:CAMPEP_0118958392 /NCGR_PEP_ID=MMETSP1169-20130426/62597_1 /TAXON_ID=36882 /ORGANISM="Pyramimonas obovata, Strain CCMP722" /LENGTH=249 /DNA_ID=CAMNT_0006906507 /DNA_START=2000 /DNA_END=2749 /DNA_ORIENTATION=-